MSGTVRPPERRDRPPDHAVTPRRPIAAAGVGVVFAALALSIIVASGGIGGWEKTVVDDGIGVTGVVGYPAEAIMQLGTQAAMIAIAGAAAALTWRWRPGLALLVAGWAAWLATRWAKEAVDRPRPPRSLWHASAGGSGYPSGHTSTAFAVATVVAFLLPVRWRWVPFTLAAVVGLARIHVGVHYPMDVLGGALIGLAVGLLAVALVNPARAG